MPLGNSLDLFVGFFSVTFYVIVLCPPTELTINANAVKARSIGPMDELTRGLIRRT
jgi:hypothetical protein